MYRFLPILIENANNSGVLALYCFTSTEISLPTCNFVGFPILVNALIADDVLVFDAPVFLIMPDSVSPFFTVIVYVVFSPLFLSRSAAFSETNPEKQMFKATIAAINTPVFLNL